MKLWRLAASTRTYGADDLSGAGAAKYPGRWNEANQRVVYCAGHPSLAVLETAAHIDDAGLPLNRFLVEIDVPDAVWARSEMLDVATLGATWEAIPAGQDSVRAGSAWYRAGRTALLQVPSVIVPEERAVLINAVHVDAARIKARIVRQFDYNRLFRGQA